MRIRPRLKSIVRNKETSKLPYWVEDEYSDFQQLTSQKYIQDNYGKFPESEFQQPYKLDEEDDYQFLEYLYSVPEFPTIPIPDVDVTKTRPKGNCEELWRELFGDSKVPFIPDESDLSKIRKYAEKCPLEYLPHICCKDMKINGPTDVTPGQTVEYTVTGGLPGCAYSWKSGKGRMAEGTYTAPDTSGTDEISVSPWMSDDQDKKCAKKSITIGDACNGVIAYTTLQMQVSTTQTLKVTGAVEGETYSWSTTSGSVSPSEGTSVTFTAPATNPNCANNATVSITCGGNVVNSITITINAVKGTAGGVCVRDTDYDSCNPIRSPYHPNPVIGYWCVVRAVKKSLSCAGVLSTAGFGDCADQRYPPLATCELCQAAAATKCLTGQGISCPAGAYDTYYDTRTALQKLQGCCPSQLM